MIADIYFTLLRTSRTNFHESSTHTGGTFQKEGVVEKNGNQTHLGSGEVVTRLVVEFQGSVESAVVHEAQP